MLAKTLYEADAKPVLIGGHSLSQQGIIWASFGCTQSPFVLLFVSNF